jgi:energy-coupling factor transporter ATP-binding protein EcfA2
MFIKFEKCTCNMSHGPHGSFCYYMLSMGYMLPTVYHELLHNFAGSLILVGGDPGVGKSSLILQLASIMSENIGAGESSAIVYVSGEEVGYCLVPSLPFVHSQVSTVSVSCWQIHGHIY